MKVLYLDEAGSHSLLKSEPKFPVFVLGGVLIDHGYLHDVVEPRVEQLKAQFFGRHDFSLHTAEIVRALGAFASLADQARKRAFVEALTSLLADTDFQVLACAIRKPAFLERGGDTAADLYRMCLEVLIDQFCLDLGGADEVGLVYAERRRPDLDGDLELAWETIRRQGTGRTGGDVLSRRILELILKDKRVNNVGLQLADLVVTPIGRTIAGYPPRPDWDLISSKIWSRVEFESEFGLTVLPE